MRNHPANSFPMRQCGQRIEKPLRRAERIGGLISLDHLDAPEVTAAGKRRGQPDRDDFQGQVLGEHAFAERENVAIVVFAGQTRALEAPAKSAANAADFVGDHGFAVARAAENDAAVELAARDSFRRGANEQGIIYRLGAERAEVADFVAEAIQKQFDFFLVGEAGVVGGDGYLHARRVSAGTRSVKRKTGSSRPRHFFLFWYVACAVAWHHAGREINAASRIASAAKPKCFEACACVNTRPRV